MIVSPTFLLGHAGDALVGALLGLLGVQGLDDALHRAVDACNKVNAGNVGLVQYCKLLDQNISGQNLGRKIRPLSLEGPTKGKQQVRAEAQQRGGGRHLANSLTE